MVSKVVAKQDGGGDGEHFERLGGGALGTQGESRPQKQVPREEQNEEVCVRGGDYKGTGNGPITG
jgi:hypothetical protein